MTFQIQKRGDARLRVQPKFSQVGDKIIGSTQWLNTEGGRQERFEVLTVRDAKIVDIQGCTSHREAERFARRH